MIDESDIRIEQMVRMTGRPEIERSVPRPGNDAGTLEWIGREYLGGDSYILIDLQEPTIVCSIRHGRVVDGVKSTVEGSFSRSYPGSLPVGQVVEAACGGERSFPGGEGEYISEGYPVEEVQRARAYHLAKDAGGLAAGLGFDMGGVLIVPPESGRERWIDALEERLRLLPGKVLTLLGPLSTDRGERGSES